MLRLSHAGSRLFGEGVATRQSCLMLFVLCSVIFPGALMAQQPPTIERRLPDSIRPPAGIPSEEFILTGEDDIVLLRRRKFFSFSIDGDARYTNNAFLTDDLKESDVAVTARARLRAETRLAQRYTVYVEGGVFSTRYDDNSVLDFDGYEGGLGVSFPVSSWTFSADYRGTKVEERGFDAHIITQHEISATGAYTYRLGEASYVFPYLRVARLWTAPSDFERVSLRPGVSAVHVLSADLSLIANFQLLAEFYDAYFEQTFSRDRRDYGALGGLTLRWTPALYATATAGVAGGYTNSTINVLDYSEFSVVPSISLKIRF